MLNLSMNKILRIEASFTAACPNLTHLILSDNLMKQIDANMFASIGATDKENRGPRLQVLDLSINQVNVIENLQNLKNLKELNLRQNQISVIEGLSQLQ